MLDKLDAALRLQQDALNLRARRQGSLAANIANADTPGFQARDIDFSSELKKVMERGRAENSGVALALTSARHIPAQTVTTPSIDLLYRIPDQPSLDGNTVDMDRERTQFADNSLQYQMGLTVLGGQIKGMMNVLQGNDWTAPPVTWRTPTAWRVRTGNLIAPNRWYSRSMRHRAPQPAG